MVADAAGGFPVSLHGGDLDATDFIMADVRAKPDRFPCENGIATILKKSIEAVRA